MSRWSTENFITYRGGLPMWRMVPSVNLAEQHGGQLKNDQVTLTGIGRKPAKVWSCFRKNGVRFQHDGNQLTLTLPSLQTTDVIVISQQWTYRRFARHSVRVVAFRN